MSDHPIEALMQTAMESIREMVDVNTVVGDPVETPDGSVIIPVSRVSAGFAAGGSEYEAASGSGGEGGGKQEKNQQQNPPRFPFGGGSGAGVSVKPVGFLVSTGGRVRLLPVDSNVILDHLIEMSPKIISQVRSLFGKQDEKAAPRNEE